MASRVAFGSKQGCYSCFAALRCRRELLGRPLLPRTLRPGSSAALFNIISVFVLLVPFVANLTLYQPQKAQEAQDACLLFLNEIRDL